MLYIDLRIVSTKAIQIVKAIFYLHKRRLRYNSTKLLKEYIGFVLKRCYSIEISSFTQPICIPYSAHNDQICQNFALKKYFI
jgi:hypothetical protein